VLTTDTDTPVVTETTMSTDLLQTLEIITVLGVKNVGDNLRGLTIDNILLSVKEPSRDLILGRVLENGDDTFQFFGRKLTGSLGEVNIGLLTGNVGKTTTNTLDRGQSNLDLDTTVNVSVEETDNVLELLITKRKMLEKLFKWHIVSFIWFKIAVTVYIKLNVYEHFRVTYMVSFGDDERLYNRKKNVFSIHPVSLSSIYSIFPILIIHLL
jgi:hypothetical protein